MDWAALFDRLTTGEELDLLLTIVLTGAVVWQTRLTGILARVASKQATISATQVAIIREAEARQRRLEDPQIRFSSISYTHASTGIDGNIRTDRFVGFSVTNASLREISIAYLGIDFAIKHEGGTRISKPIISPVIEFRDKNLSDTDLPRRLRYGDTLRVHYNHDDLSGKGRIRYTCRDSLGNTYYADCWMGYTEGSETTYGDPGPGCFSLEEWLHRGRRPGGAGSSAR